MLSKTYILQSFESTEKIKSGKELAVKLEGVMPVYFNDVEDRDQLFFELEKIKEEIVNNTEKSIIHFDCHGNEDGIELFDKNNNGTGVSWEDFRDKFREIYIAAPIKPIISFSSCRGLHVMKLIAQFEPCPYETIAGCLEDIEFEDSIEAFHQFYTDLNSNISLVDSTANVSDKYPQLKFFSIPANILATLAWERYKKEKLTPEVAEERKAEIVQQILQLTGTITPTQLALLDKQLAPESGELDQARHMKIFNS